VMLSANAMRQHRLDAEAAGADLHLPKPVTATRLVEGMMEALQARTEPDFARDLQKSPAPAQ
jgi:CheY-like chemotaxis protein